jgi:hypothetical protein
MNSVDIVTRLRARQQKNADRLWAKLTSYPKGTKGSLLRLAHEAHHSYSSNDKQRKFSFAGDINYGFSSCVPVRNVFTYLHVIKSSGI